MEFTTGNLLRADGKPLAEGIDITLDERSPDTNSRSLSGAVTVPQVVAGSVQVGDAVRLEIEDGSAATVRVDQTFSVPEFDEAVIFFR